MPPLQKQAVTVPILGLDTHVDPKTAPPGTLTLAENIVYRRTAQGALEAIKRNGVTARSTAVLPTGNVSTGRKLAAYNDEQLIIGDSLYSWSSATTKWTKRVAQANMPACTLTNLPVGAQVRGAVTSWDQAVGGGWICTVWSQGSNQPSRITIVDATSGAHILDQDLTWSVTTGVREIHVVALNAVFMIVACFETTGTLASRIISFSSPTSISAEVSVSGSVFNAGGANHFDMIRPGTNDWVLIAIYTTTPNTTFIRWNSGQTSGGSSTSAEVGDLGFSWLTWDASDGNMYLAYVNLANGTKIYPVNATTAAVGAAVTADASWKVSGGITGYRVGTSNILFAGSTAGSSLNPVISRWSGASFVTFQRGLTIYGRPFTAAGRTYLPCQSNDNGGASTPTGGVHFDQRTFFLLDVGDATFYGSPVAAKAFFGESGGSFTFCAPVSTSVLSANKVCIPCVRLSAPTALLDVVTGATAAGGGVHEPCALILDFTIPGCSPPTVAAETLLLPGGAVKEWDDNVLAEAGFHMVPIAPTLTSGGTGNLTPSKTYQAVVVWAYVDNRGDVHYSAPSQAAPVTLSALQNSISCACQTYRISERALSCWVELYLTQGDGFIFYLVGRTPNDPTSDTVTINVASPITDASLGTQAQLYTQDGSLAHVPLPPARLMCAYRNRVILAGTEDPCDIWVSDERITGLGVSFSDANIVQVDREGGAITAIAEFDDRVIIFKRNAIFEMAGPGPAPNGSGGFDLPSRLTATVGCIAPESVVRTPQGLIFQSARGFCLLPPGGGLPVRMRAIEAFETLTVTGAVNLEAVEQARFTTSAGTTLVYHYGFTDDQGMGRWSVHTGQVAVDCGSYGGAFVFLTSAGVVQVENAAWDDNGAAVQARVQFAWLNPAGGFGGVRLWRLYPQVDVVTGFALNLSLEVDYAAGAVQSATFAVTSTGSPAIELRPARQDAFAYRVTVSETSTTQGFKLSGLALELGAYGQLKPVATTQRFT